MVHDPHSWSRMDCEPEQSLHILKSLLSETFIPAGKLTEVTTSEIFLTFAPKVLELPCTPN